MTFQEAADILARQDFRDAIKSHSQITGLQAVTQSGDAQAGITNCNVLIVIGSDSWRDYTRYNFRPFRRVPATAQRHKIAKALPVDMLHGGFLLHACEVLAFLGDRRPDFIVGHSLGAGSAQILGTVLDVPTICYAPPQVVRRRFLNQHQHLMPEHPQWNVFNVAWNQDVATKIYRLFGLRCLGFRSEVRTPEGKLGISHFPSHYQELIANNTSCAQPKLPGYWRSLDYCRVKASG